MTNKRPSRTVRHFWRDNWPFFAVVLPGLFLIIGVLGFFIGRSENQTRDYKYACLHAGGIPIDMPGDNQCWRDGVEIHP